MRIRNFTSVLIRIKEGISIFHLVLIKNQRLLNNFTEHGLFPSKSATFSSRFFVLVSDSKILFDIVFPPFLYKLLSIIWKFCINLHAHSSSSFWILPFVGFAMFDKFLKGIMIACEKSRAFYVSSLEMENFYFYKLSWR